MKIRVGGYKKRVRGGEEEETEEWTGVRGNRGGWRKRKTYEGGMGMK